MNRFFVLLVILCLLTLANAQAIEGLNKIDNFLGGANSSPILVFASNNRQVQPLDEKLLKFISDTLHTGKPSLKLNCDVKVREITEEKKFSDGVRRIQMLEIIYKTNYMNLPEEKMYFPVDSQITKEVKVSKFAGTVEEIQLQSDDLANSRFIFQHNGRGEIVWMSFEDDQKTAPCALNR